MARQSKLGFLLSFSWDQYEARTKTVYLITLKKKKHKKKATKHPRLLTRTKELSDESQSRQVIYALVHHPAD